MVGGRGSAKGVLSVTVFGRESPKPRQERSGTALYRAGLTAPSLILLTDAARDGLAAKSATKRLRSH
jgi:hypothetical protein